MTTSTYRWVIVLLTCSLIIGGGLSSAFAISPGWPGNPATYLKITSMEYPILQYRDGSMLAGTQSPYGPFTCEVQLYLNANDPTQFEVLRTFEPRYPNNVYGPSQYVSAPAVSASYAGSGRLANNVTGLVVYPHPENPYGRETLSFYTLDAHGNPKTLLEARQIMVYPRSTAKIFNALSLTPNPIPNPSPIASPSPYPSLTPYPLPTPSAVSSFTGDLARLNVQIFNAYPGGDTWVVVYAGRGSTNPPANAKEIPNSRQTAPSNDMVPRRDLYLETGSAKDASGNPLFPFSSTQTTYTVQVMQKRSPYSLESIGAASFTIKNSSYLVNSQLGKAAQ